MSAFYIFLLSFVIIFVGCRQEPSINNTNQSDHNYKGPIIDMHIHAYDENTGKMMFGMDYINPLTGDKFLAVNNAEEQRNKTFEKFKQFNIVKALVSDGELWHEYNPEMIIISGRNQTVEQLRTRYESGKLHAIGEMVNYYGGITADDPRLIPYFNLAQELNVPVSYHVFPGGPPGGIYNLGMREVRVSKANPLQIEEVLVKHPKLKFILAHAGWPYLEYIKGLMYAHPQLNLELGVISWILPRAEFHFYLKSLVNAGFGKRIMFGTDQMVWPETIDKAVESIQSANFLSLEQKADIFYNNASKILELDDKEINKHKNSN